MAYIRQKDRTQDDYEIVVIGDAALALTTMPLKFEKVAGAPPTDAVYLDFQLPEVVQ